MEHTYRKRGRPRKAKNLHISDSLTPNMPPPAAVICAENPTGTIADNMDTEPRDPPVIRHSSDAATLLPSRQLTYDNYHEAEFRPHKADLVTNLDPKAPPHLCISLLLLLKPSRSESHLPCAFPFPFLTGQEEGYKYSTYSPRLSEDMPPRQGYTFCIASQNSVLKQLHCLTESGPETTQAPLLANIPDSQEVKLLQSSPKKICEIAPIPAQP